MEYWLWCKVHSNYQTGWGEIRRWFDTYLHDIKVKDEWITLRMTPNGFAHGGQVGANFTWMSQWIPVPFACSATGTQFAKLSAKQTCFQAQDVGWTNVPEVFECDNTY